MPEFIAPAFTFTSLISIGLPFFLVTMASQNAPGFATMQASGYPLAVSPLIVATGGLALLLSPFGVYSICIAAITAAICQSPDAHPDASKRWLAAAAAGGFYLLAGVFGGSISGLMAALPLSGIQTLAGLALLGTISGSLYQALNHEAERDAAIVTFLTTASGVTLWELAPLSGGWCWVGSVTLSSHAFAARSCDGVMPVMLRKRLLKWLAELNPQASAMSVSGVVVC